MAVCYSLGSNTNRLVALRTEKGGYRGGRKEDGFGESTVGEREERDNQIVLDRGPGCLVGTSGRKYRTVGGKLEEEGLCL